MINKILQVMLAAGLISLLTANSAVSAETSKDEQKAKLFEIFKLRCKGDINAVRALLSYKEDKYSKIKEYAVNSLIYIAQRSVDKNIVPVLTDLYRNDKDQKVRNAARAGLVKLKEPGVFIEDLKSDDLRTKISAARNLIEIGTDEAKSEIIILLVDSAVENRYKEDIAIEAGKHGIYQALPMLVKLYEKSIKKQEIVNSIAELAEIGNATAIEELRKIYNDGSTGDKGNVCNAAMELAERNSKVIEGNYYEGKIKWPWLGQDLLKDISHELQKEKFDINKLESLFAAINKVEDEKYYLQAYDMAKAFPELTERISEWINEATDNGIAVKKRDTIDLKKVEKAIENLNNMDLSKPNNNMTEPLCVLCIFNKFLLEEKNSKLKEEAENVLLRILEQPWVLKVTRREGTPEERIIDPEIPYMAKKILAFLGNEKAINLMYTHMKSKNEWERLEAYHCLTMQQDKNKLEQTFALLEQALDKEENTRVNGVINAHKRMLNLLIPIVFDCPIVKPDSFKEKMKKWVVNHPDWYARTEIMNNLLKKYPDDENIISLYFKLLNDKNEGIQKSVVLNLVRYCLVKDNGIKQFASEMDKFGTNQRKEILEVLQRYLSPSALATCQHVIDEGEYSAKVDFEHIIHYKAPSYNSINKNELALALILESSYLVLCNWVCLDNVCGKFMELIENNNTDPQLFETAVSSFAWVIGHDISGMLVDPYIHEQLFMILAEQYDKVSNITKYEILKGLFAIAAITDIAGGHAADNDVIKAVWNKASVENDDKISKLAKDYLKRIGSH